MADIHDQIRAQEQQLENVRQEIYSCNEHLRQLHSSEVALQENILALKQQVR